MGITIVGDQSLAVTQPDAAVFIRTKKNWSDDWVVRPEIEFGGATWASASQDLSTLNMRRRYGRVMSPGETMVPTTPIQNVKIPDRKPLDLDGHWVSAFLVTPQNHIEQIWIGRIENEPRTMHKLGLPTAAGGSAKIESGEQDFVAFGPLQILRKITAHESYWLVQIPDPDDTTPPFATVPEEKYLGWFPVMNGRDERNMLVGNKSDTRGIDPSTEMPSDSEPYIFGGIGIWTHYDFLEYIVKRHAQQYDDEGAKTGPIWTIGGQAELLKNISTTLNFGRSQKIHEIIQALVSPDYGVEWTIKWTKVGFEIYIYALTGEEVGYGGVKLPKNNNNLHLNTASGDRFMLPPRVEKTSNHQYDRVTLVGRRIVCCCTLELFTRAERDADASKIDSLEPLWSEDLETAYKAGSTAEGAGPAEHDIFRKRDIFRPVYQMYGAPRDWNHQNGQCCPSVSPVGALVFPKATEELTVTQNALYQNTNRATLRWTPLREGFDYSGDAPVDNNAEGVEGEFLEPACYLLDEATQKYLLSEDCRIHLSNLRQDLGIFLSADPNYTLAFGTTWDGTTPSDPDHPIVAAKPGDSEPKYDYRKMKIRIAFETDVPLRLEYQASQPRGDNSEHVIEDNDAECWFLAPNTVIGINEAGALTRSNATNAMLLRSDVERLALQMAGAIARYGRPRYMAEVRFKGLLPMADLVGTILASIDEGQQNKRKVDSPITGIQWSVSEGAIQTILTAGFAQ